jgi:5-formyltetrahydrofolate cyclo-ligase
MFRNPCKGWSIPILTVEKKKHMRARLRAIRAELALSIRAGYGRRVADLLQELDAFERAGTIALYRAIDGEVDPQFIAKRAECLGMRVCYPKVTRDNPLAFFTATQWTKGDFGYEPVGDPVGIDQIDLMLVPGIAFSDAGDRLGFGGGYYDRTLRAFSGISVGLAYPFQLHETLITDAWDVPVDRILVDRAYPMG